MKEGLKGEVGLVSFTSRREWEENLAGMQCASETGAPRSTGSGWSGSAGRPSPGTGQPGQRTGVRKHQELFQRQVTAYPLPRRCSRHSTRPSAPTCRIQ